MAMRKKKSDAVDEIEAAEKARKTRLRGLREDKAFIVETERMTAELTRLSEEHPEIFRSFFKHFVYLMLFRPGKLEKALEKVKRPQAKEVLREFAKYASRFQVWIKRSGKSFRISARVPSGSKFRANLVDGRCCPMNPEAPGVEVIFDGLYDDDTLGIPVPQLEGLLRSGDAKLVQLDDKSGSSVLNALESFAYEPAALTFILHNSERPYLFLLVGEKIETDTTWRDAAKVVTALQHKLYGRRKAGRPANVKKLRKAIYLRKQKGVDLKQQAYKLDPKPVGTRGPEVNQVYLSQVGKQVKARPSK
jgi:hypothetical protein